MEEPDGLDKVKERIASAELDKAVEPIEDEVLEGVYRPLVRDRT